MRQARGAQCVRVQGERHAECDEYDHQIAPEEVALAMLGMHFVCLPSDS